MSMLSKGQIFSAIVEFFENDDWHFHHLEELPVLSMLFTGKNGKWMCYAQAREDQQQFVYYSVCPINVPPSKLAAAAEFITRANYGMIIGNFELDYEDGEIRYKTSIDVEGDDLSEPLVKQMVYANVIIMDRYLPGIMRVMYGDADPLEEIRSIEGKEDILDLPKSSYDDLHLSDNLLSQLEDILSHIDDETDSPDDEKPPRKRRSSQSPDDEDNSL